MLELFLKIGDLRRERNDILPRISLYIFLYVWIGSNSQVARNLLIQNNRQSYIKLRNPTFSISWIYSLRDIHRPSIVRAQYFHVKTKLLSTLTIYTYNCFKFAWTYAIISSDTSYRRMIKIPLRKFIQYINNISYEFLSLSLFRQGVHYITM